MACLVDPGGSFETPGTPGGASIVEISVFLIFVFDFSVWQRQLADFFHYSQIEARCHIYWFDMYKSDNIPFHSHNGWIFKVIQDVSVVIWKESELISPVWFWNMNSSFGAILAAQSEKKKYLWASFEGDFFNFLFAMENLF